MHVRARRIYRQTLKNTAWSTRKALKVLSALNAFISLATTSGATVIEGAEIVNLLTLGGAAKLLAAGLPAFTQADFAG